MKSKSPFAMKSPLLAYKSDQRGNYADPEHVPRIDVGAVVGAHAAKTADDVFSSISQADKAKQKAATDKASGGSNVNNQTVNVSVSGSGSGGKKEYKFGHDFGKTKITPGPPRFPGGKGSSSGEGYSEDRYRELKKTGESTRGSSGTFANNDQRKYYEGRIAKHMESGMNKDQAIQTYRKNHNIGKEIPGETTTINQTARDLFNKDGKLIQEGKWIDQDINEATAMNMKGSPVKHNAETALADAKQNNPFARMLKSNNVQQRLDAAKSQPRNFAGVIAQAISDQGGSAAGSIGQQIGNQAQQRAADAGGSTGVDPFLPPPNQVAETGSYGGGGDRDVLEMNSNIINNQSIGRNTDITSQLFGSGQRASMLAMKGTPLHHDSEKQAHTHPTKTTTKISGKGEMPGSSYVKGDLVDEDDLNTVGLQTQNATLAQSDDKGAFIKEKPYTGPESNFSAKGFGEKIRLNNMSRPDYTTNEGDQMDPHNFLFQNTPKK
jgi:hypothetical protein